MGAIFVPRLAALREARGLTQLQTAHASGAPQRSVSCYQNVAPNEVHGLAPTRDDRWIYVGSVAAEAEVWLMSVE